MIISKPSPSMPKMQLILIISNQGCACVWWWGSFEECLGVVSICWVLGVLGDLGDCWVFLECLDLLELSSCRAFSKRSKHSKKTQQSPKSPKTPKTQQIETTPKHSSKLPHHQTQAHPWFDIININCIFGIDGLGLLMIILTAFLIPICIMLCWNRSLKNNAKDYIIAFLLLESILFAVFSSLDIMLFYLLFEAVLIPMFLIIGF
jgi:hypothetical protein